MVHLGMVEKPKKTRNETKASILGDKTFAAITAVEGLKLPRASKRRIAALKQKKLTPAQRRAEVLRAYLSGKGN